MGELQRYVPGPLRPHQDLDLSGIRHERDRRSVDHLLGRIRTEVNHKIQVGHRTASRDSSAKTAADITAAHIERRSQRATTVTYPRSLESDCPG